MKYIARAREVFQLAERPEKFVISLHPLFSTEETIQQTTMLASTHVAGSVSDWNPLSGPPALPTGSVPRPVITRLQRDLHQIAESPLPGILVAQDESSILRIHALVIGPEETPYANGFFHFLLQFPMGEST